jgi:hypothetical protein
MDSLGELCVRNACETYTDFVSLNLQGFQGLRQYERLRQLAPANNTSGRPLDRFHNGINVLPEVRKWHDYLRGHLRISDTTTELVLDMVETKLLQPDPAERYNMKKLCKQLEELSSWAEHKIKSLEKHSRDPDAMVLRALSAIEDEASTQKSSENKLNLLQQPLLQVNPRERASMQINKEEMIRNKPLGQTTHRKEILDRKLEDCHVMATVAEPLANDDGHFGAVTDSPTDSTLLHEPQFDGRRPKPPNPRFPVRDQGQASGRPHTPPNPQLLATPPSSDRQNRISTSGPGGYSHNPYSPESNDVWLDFGPAANCSPELAQINPSTSHRPRVPNLQISTADSPTGRHSAGSIPPSGVPELSFTSEKNLSLQDVMLRPSSVIRSTKSESTAKFPPHIPTQSFLKSNVEEKVSTVSVSNSVGSPLDSQRVLDPVVDTSSPVELDTTAGPPMISSDLRDTWSSQESPETPRPSTYDPDKQAVERASQEPDDSFPQELPQSALFLPYDICVKRRNLEEQVPKGISKGFARIKGSFGIETRTRDSSLIETFSAQRELVSLLQILTILT